MFRRLFGESKSKDNRPYLSSGSRSRQMDDAHRTITQLQESEEMMKKKLEKFDQEICDLQEKARQCLAKSTPDRLGAIRLIKRRKQIEQQRDKLWQMKENISLVNQQVQTSHFNRQVTDSLNIGQQHLKQTQKSMRTNQIEDIIDNLTEQMQISNEINDLLATPIPTADLTTTTTDLELENELEDLNKEIIRENLTEIHLPNAHSAQIKLSKSRIDQELEELQRLTTG